MSQATESNTNPKAACGLQPKAIPRRLVELIALAIEAGLVAHGDLVPDRWSPSVALLKGTESPGTGPRCAHIRILAFATFAFTRETFGARVWGVQGGN